VIAVGMTLVVLFAVAAVMWIRTFNSIIRDLEDDDE
jgi:hypothetical protein